MRQSIRLGRVAGIPIGMNWSVLLVAALVTFNLARYVLPETVPGLAGVTYLAAGIFTAVGFLASILLHELGHAMAAKRDDIGVNAITLWLLGGVAQLEREPSTPGSAFRVAIAGPAVSLGIAVVSGLIGLGGTPFGLAPIVMAGFLWLGVINAVLALFNMLPGSPLDGGRVLQAYKWHRSGDRDAATVSAATAGRYVGWGLVALGLFGGVIGIGTSLWTAMIGWFLVTAARQERKAAERRIMARSRMADRPTFFNMPIFEQRSTPHPTTGWNGGFESTERSPSRSARFPGRDIIDAEVVSRH